MAKIRKFLLLLTVLLAANAFSKDVLIDLRQGQGLYSFNATASDNAGIQEAIIKAGKGDTISFATPDGIKSGQVILAYTDGNGVKTRAGELEGENGSFILTIFEDDMAGTLEDRETGRCIEWQGSKSEAASSVSNLSLEEACSDWLPGGDLPIPEEVKSSGSNAFASTAATSSFEWDDDEIVRIRVVTFYTPAALAKLGGHSKMNQAIAKGIAKGNLCLAISETRCQLDMVHSEQWNYEEAGSSYTDLARFVNANGGFEGVWGVRNRVGAGLCALAGREDDVGGLAYVNYSAAGYPENSFHFIRDVQMDGDSWVHEMGHNIGCQHAWDQDSSPGPTSGGLYGHSLGYYFIGKQDQGTYATVMAYSQHGYERCDHFSNPKVSYKGTPTGASKQNCALTWDKIRKVARTYRTLVKPTLGEWSYEGFSYPARETLDTKAGGLGWNSGWTAASGNYPLTSAESLEYSDGEKSLATMNGSLNGGGYTYSWSRMPAQPGYQSISFENLGETSVWLSILVRPNVDSHNNFFVEFEGTTFGGASDGIWCVNGDAPEKTVEMETGRTDLLLARYDIYSENEARVTLWVNPKLEEEPDESGRVASGTGYVYWDSGRQVCLRFSGSFFQVDELRVGSSAQSVLPSKHPMISASQGGTNGFVKVSWPLESAGEKVRIYRRQAGSQEEPALLGEIEQAAELLDFAAEEGTVYEYFAQGDYAWGPSRRVGPVKGFRGAPKFILNANGPYTVKKGQNAIFSADGSIGCDLSYAWKCYKVESDYSPLFENFVRTNNFVPGTYEVVLSARDLFFPEAEIAKVQTQLIVENSDPKAAFEFESYEAGANENIILKVLVQDELASDKLQYRFRLSAEGEFGEWTERNYLEACFATVGTNVEVACQVKDAYGAQTEVKTSVTVLEARTLLSATPAKLDLEGRMDILFAVQNKGGLAATITPKVPEWLLLEPASCTVQNEIAVFKLMAKRPDLIAKGSGEALEGNVELGFTNLTVRLSDPLANLVKVTANGPYDVKLGDCQLLEAQANDAGYYACQWLLDGEPLCEASKDAYVLPFKAECEAGTHSLETRVLDQNGKIMAACTNDLKVSVPVPGALFSFVSRNGNEVTMKAIATSPVHCRLRCAFATGDEWQEEGNATLKFWGEDLFRIYFEILDDYSQTGRIDMNVDLRSKVPFVTPVILCGGEALDEVEVACGQSLALSATADKGGYAGDLRFLWRAFGGNPTRDSLSATEGESVTTAPLEPGTHYYTLYALAGDRLSLPKTIKVTVTGRNCLAYQCGKESLWALSDGVFSNASLVSSCDQRGRFLVAGDMKGVLKGASATNLNLRAINSEWCAPVRILEANSLVAGLVRTNSVNAVAAVPGAIVTGVKNGNVASTESDENGFFFLELPQAFSVSNTLLTVEAKNLHYLPANTLSSCNCGLVLYPDKEKGDTSYLYLTLIDDASGFPLMSGQACMNGKTVKANQKGVCSVLNGAKGTQVIRACANGKDVTVTNLTLSGTSSSKNVRLKTQKGVTEDWLDMVFYDEDGALVSGGAFKLVAAQTSSTVLNDRDALGLQSHALLQGCKTTVRYEKTGLEKYALTIVPASYQNYKVTLVPEPLCLASLLVACLALARRNRK